MSHRTPLTDADVVGHEPPRRPTRWIALASLVAAAGLVAGAFRVLGGGEAPVERADATKSPSASQSATPPSRVGPTALPALHIFDAPPALRAIEIVAATDGQLERVTLANDSSTRTAPTSVPTVGATLWLAEDGSAVLLPTAGDQVRPVLRLRRGAQTPEVVVTAAAAVPAADGLSIWASDTLDEAAQPSDACTWSRFGLDGTPGGEVELPCGLRLLRETVAGFLGVEVDPAGTARDAVIVTSGGAATSLGALPLGATSDQVVTSSLSPDDPLVLHDLRSGESHPIALPNVRAGWAVRSGQPSASGTFVVVSLSGATSEAEIWVFDLASAGWVFVREAPRGALYGRDFSWAGDVLVLAQAVYLVFDPAAPPLYVSGLPPPGIIRALVAG